MLSEADSSKLTKNLFKACLEMTAFPYSDLRLKRKQYRRSFNHRIVNSFLKFDNLLDMRVVDQYLILYLDIILSEPELIAKTMVESFIFLFKRLSSEQKMKYFDKAEKIFLRSVDRISELMKMEKQIEMYRKVDATLDFKRRTESNGVILKN